MQRKKQVSFHLTTKKSKDSLINSLHQGVEEEPLIIQQKQLIFTEVEVNKKQQLQLDFRNNTSRLIKVKVYGPKYKVFSLDQSPINEALSAGLSKKIKINFSCQQLDNYYDQIKIVCEAKKYVIPIKALKPSIKIYYKKIIEGGMIAMNFKHKFKTIFKNNCSKSRVKIIKDNFESIYINPDEFVIQQNQQKAIEFTVTPTSAGIYRHKLLIQVNGEMVEPIHILYTSTQFKLFLANEEGNKITEFDMGNVYYGQNKEEKLFLVNNTPEVINMKSKIRLGWKFNQSALQSPQELALQCSSTIINISPCVMDIKPFTRQQIKLFCESEITEQMQRKVTNFAKRDNEIDSITTQAQKIKMGDNQYHQTLIIEYLQKKIYCSLKATCIFPMVKISPTFLDFGQISIKKTTMLKFKLENCKQLPIKVFIPKILSFQIFPNTFLLKPEQKAQVQVFLTPVSYGQFNTSIPFILSKSFRIQIPVIYSTKQLTKRISSSSHLQSRSVFHNHSINLISLAKNAQKNIFKKQKKICHSLMKQKQKSLKKSKLNMSSGFLNNQTNNLLETNHQFALNNRNQIIIPIDNNEKLISDIKQQKIPRIKDSLFVTRKIDKYSPYNTSHLKIKNQNSPKKVKKIPMSTTTGFKTQKWAKRQLNISNQLSIEALRNIEVTQKVLHFGKVFIHSQIIKQFEIINNNDFSIQVKLTSFHEYLNQTQNTPKIITAKTRSKFKIVLIAKQCGQFQNLIEYTINTVHSFRFLVQAEVQLVTLNSSKSNLKIIYQDDVKDMFLSDSFELSNEGNTQALFSIQQNSSDNMFIIQPKQGILKPCQSLQIMVVYNYQKKQNIPAGEPKNIKQFNKQTFLTIDQRLVVKVKNGLDMFLRVQSSLSEPKCFVKESRINFGCCIVPKAKNKSFILRNLSRSICLYEIDNTLSENLLTFESMTGKVLPQSSKQIMITYQSNTVQEVNMAFRVIIRGGLVISVPFNAQSIAPKISIIEENFNFGQICCGSIGIHPITIKNQSETIVQLLLDLLNKHTEGIQYLNAYFEPLEKDQSIPLEKCQEIQSVHRIKIESKSIYKFHLFFQPKVPGYYEFELPLYIQNLIKSDSMIKKVKCFAKEPKFFLEPSLIKFKKKIINDKQNACFHPLVEFVTFKNPSPNLLKWKIDLPKLENGKKHCFKLETRGGQIKSKSWQCINIFFNPYQAGFYEYKFPLLIYNWDKEQYVQEAQIKVEGQGQYPVLLFDRRELILPVVPLFVESVGMFKIINEGYQSIDIKHTIEVIDEIVPIPEIILFYPEGSKMGINKKELYVIVKFSAKKPVSFTVRLQIDDGNRCYELPISGTSDNSLFTVFPYLSDKQNMYKFEQTNETIILKNVDMRNIFDKLHNYYEQISESDYTLPCEIIRRWINSHLKDEKVIRFPQDLVASNETLLKFLYKLTNKKQFEKVPPQCEQDQEKFYQHVIRVLKSMGCLLNHIRPYYLLNKNDFMAIFEQSQLKHMIQTYRKYTVIHLDSWIILFYQAISNFWYNPQKNKAIFSEGIKSNIYSQNQISVLKWVKQIYLQYNQGEQKKLIDFNRDYRDSLASIYALHHYSFSNKNQSLEGVNKHMVSTNDYNVNTRLLYTMLNKANLIPLISEDEYKNIKQKQMYLFMYQLYQSLPQQVPKTAPIIFTCELGERCTKYIQIKNPCSKTVSYWLKIEGSQDYFVDDKQAIKIQPKSSYKLGVQFRSRVSQQQIAYLMLYNKKQSDGNNSGVGCSLVFELRSHIIGRKSIKKLDNLRCQMYEGMTIKVPVENAFNDKEYGNFKINIIEEVYQTKQSVKIFNFFVEVESLKIRRNSSSFLELTYNPLILKPIRCYIIFCDPSVGQFQYQVIGIPEVPKQLQQLKVPNPIYTNTQESIELSLPVYNNFLIKSLSLMQQKIEFLRVSGRSGKLPELMLNNDIHENEKQYLTFKVEINMDSKILQFIKFPSQLIIYHRKNIKTDIRNRLKIQCNFNMIIKDLVLDFVLVSPDKRDVRRFKAQITVTSQPILSNLLMKTNARTPLIQEIPIQNPTNKDWKISLLISQYQLPDFSLKPNQICLSRDIICKKNSNAKSQLIYNPMEVSESSCKLTITNQITSEQIIYQIKAVCEEPLSQDHLYFSTFTGKSNLHKIQIKNPYPQAIAYYIQTDLPQLQCPSQVSLDCQEKYQFSMIITANNPGLFIGYLKFIQPTQGRYFWYSVTIQAQDEVVFEQNIKLQTLIDKEIQKVLQFKNALSKPVTYRVDYDDYHGIYGQKVFDVKSYSNYLYRLKFKPSKVLKEQGTIRIFCPQKGAHIYKLQMISHEHFKRQLQSLKVQVGRTGQREIKLTQFQSSKKKKLDLSYDISNPNFSIEYQHNQQGQEISLKISYKPISEGSQKCTIKLICESNNITKVYEIEGIGIAPFTVETVEFQSIDFLPALQVVKFKNPYQGTQLAINSQIQGHKEEKIEKTDTFQISIQQNSMEVYKFVGYPAQWEAKLSPNQVIAIPIEFKSTAEGYYEAMLTVQADSYKWQFLLKGSCFNQFLNSNRCDEQIHTKTRQQGIKIITFELPQFFKKQNLKPNKVQITHKDGTLAKVLLKWLKIKIQTDYNISSKNLIKPDSNGQKITLYLRFRPNKPISQIINLSLFSQIQRSIKITKKIKLISDPPEPEQKIKIQIASIKKHIFLLPVQLPMTQLSKCSSRFEKGVYLETGIIQDKVQVRFTPNNCTFKNNSYSDLLIIESEEQYRSYEIIIILLNKQLHKALK